MNFTLEELQSLLRASSDQLDEYMGRLEHANGQHFESMAEHWEKRCDISQSAMDKLIALIAIAREEEYES